MTWRDEDIAGNSPAQAWSDDDVAPTPTNTIGQEFKRQAGLTGRAALSAVGSFGVIPADIIGKAVNYAMNKEVIPNQQRALQQTLTRMGFPEPERGMEKFTQGVGESVPAMLLPGTIGHQVFGNAAVSSALAPQGQEGSAAAIGGAFGTIAPVMGGLVKPTAEAVDLMRRGVALTPGQAAGKGSVAKTVEEYASTLPVASHFVRSAQNRAIEEANVAAAQAVVKLVDDKVKLGKPPREAIETTRETIGKTYDAALENMDVPAVFPHAALSTRITSLPTDFPLMPADDFKRMENFVNVRMANLAKNSGGTITGSQLKQLDSELGQYVRNLQRSTNAADKTAAPAWAELQQSIRDVMTFAQADPAKQQQLQSANGAYRQLLALEKALLPGNATFTPRRLTATLQRMGIEGKDLNAVANNMQATLPNAVPSSGTAERMFAASLPALLMGGGGVAQGMGFDTLGAGMLTAGALGSRPGAKFLTGSYATQRALANALRKDVPGYARYLTRDDEEQQP